MPNYNHKCTECNHVDEVFYFLSKFDENEFMDCPKCGGKTFKRSISAVGFDIIGYCYDNTVGKKAWKKNLSPTEQAKVLTRERDPY